MSEAAQPEVSVEEEATAEAVVPMFIPTKWAQIAVYGWQLISKSTIDLVATMLAGDSFEEADHGVRVIVFGDMNLKDDDGKKVLAGCWLGAGVIGIDLVRMFETSVLRCRTSQKGSSIWSWYLMNTLISVVHEAYHLSLEVDGKGAGTEADAEKFAHDLVFDLAKAYNVEPGGWEEDPFFFKAMVAMEPENDTEEALEWLANQQHMLENRLFYWLPGTEDKIEVMDHCFKDYLRRIAGDANDDQSWMGEPLPIPPIAMAAFDPNHGAEEPKVEEPTVTELVKEAVGQATNLSPKEMYYALEALEGPDEDDGIDYDVGGLPSLPEGYSSPDLDSTETTIGQQPTVIQRQKQQPLQFLSADTRQAQATPQNPTPTAPPQVAQYQPTSLDNQTWVATVQRIYNKIYQHIFTYCGAHTKGFANADKVYRMPIELEAQEAECVVKMDCCDQNGRWCPGMPAKYQIGGEVKARIAGSVSKNTGMPQYKLWLNANGQELVRFICPQNPLKQSGNGQFSKPALAAQSGSCIMYICEGNDQVAQATGKKFLHKIVDGQMIAC